MAVFMPIFMPITLFYGFDALQCVFSGLFPVTWSSPASSHPLKPRFSALPPIYLATYSNVTVFNKYRYAFCVPMIDTVLL